MGCNKDNTLLKKYIQHVSDCEGTDFIDGYNGRDMRDVVFSDEEIKEL